MRDNERKREREIEREGNWGQMEMERGRTQELLTNGRQRHWCLNTLAPLSLSRNSSAFYPSLSHGINKVFPVSSTVAADLSCILFNFTSLLSCSFSYTSQLSACIQSLASRFVCGGMKNKMPPKLLEGLVQRKGTHMLWVELYSLPYSNNQVSSTSECDIIQKQSCSRCDSLTLK